MYVFGEGDVVGDLLNFNPNRNLEFDSGRKLEFDPNRGVDFNPNRDLGFGQRGVVFRGYVCPICGALVSEDAPKCPECGTVFEGEPRAAPPATPPQEGKPMAPAPPADSSLSRAANFCAYCGVNLRPGDRVCWKCGSRVRGATEAVKLPPKKSEHATRPWKGQQQR